MYMSFVSLCYQKGTQLYAKKCKFNRCVPYADTKAEFDVFEKGAGREICCFRKPCTFSYSMTFMVLGICSVASGVAPWIEIVGGIANHVVGGRDPRNRLPLSYGEA